MRPGLCYESPGQIVLDALEDFVTIHVKQRHRANNVLRRARAIGFSLVFVFHNGFLGVRRVDEDDVKQIRSYDPSLFHPLEQFGSVPAVRR